MTPDAIRKARKRGYHHDPYVAAQLGIEWLPANLTMDAAEVASKLGVCLRTIMTWQARGEVSARYEHRAVLVDGRVRLRSEEP
jgi:hypothetical protein